MWIRLVALPVRLLLLGVAEIQLRMAVLRLEDSRTLGELPRLPEKSGLPLAVTRRRLILATTTFVHDSTP
jgi:hypothetical protein